VTWDYACETGKRRYPTAGDVRNALQGVKRRHQRQKPYHCTTCNGWHLTSYLHETRPKSRAKTLFRRRQP
jgi:hypothetical protein